MGRILALAAAVGAAAVGSSMGACSGSGAAFSDGGADGGNNIPNDAQFGGDGVSPGGDSGPTTTVIYAHTDTELYSVDPVSHQVTDIGAFQGMGGGTNDSAVTDLAVDANDEVFVNTESVVYRAALPSSGKGAVTLTKVVALGTGTRFYALGFVPAGFVGSSEALVAGDSAGHLYYVDVAGAKPPLDLGGFGTDTGGKTWELSGDVVFYTSSGAPKGLATIRSCTGTTCNGKNDSLAEIDMAALQQAFTSKTPAPSLRKQILGTGTGFGRLFGIGAWADSVYAFSRASSGAGASPAELVQISAAGTGTSLQTFSGFTNGWSGAGVNYAKANITIIK